MNSIRTDDLDKRSRALNEAFTADSFRTLSEAMTELLSIHLTQAAGRQRPVWPATNPEELLADWPEPESGTRENFLDVAKQIVSQSTSQHHPGFIGQQISVPLAMAGPIGMLTAILNNSAAIFEGAPVAVALERRLIDWMISKVGYPADAGGVFTSGGTLGALTAMLAIRQAKMSTDVWQQGFSETERVAILVSEQAHYCHGRACSLLGFGEKAIIPLDTDARFRIDPDALQAAYRKCLADGIRPLAVVANAGSTATGSMDPLEKVAEFCERHELWMHVDAAHGGSDLLSQRRSSRLQGIERADSIVWDAHKMMFMPSFCTAVLFKKRQHLAAAFRQQANYLFLDEQRDWTQPGLYNFETTKPTMVFQLYLALKTLGVDFLARGVEYLADLATAFALEIENRDDFELLVIPESNIVCFRFAGCGAADELQVQLRDRINREGNFFIMRTELRSRTWLRVVLMNPATRLADLTELLNRLSQLGSQIDHRGA